MVTVGILALKGDSLALRVLLLRVDWEVPGPLGCPLLLPVEGRHSGRLIVDGVAVQMAGGEGLVEVGSLGGLDGAVVARALPDRPAAGGVFRWPVGFHRSLIIEFYIFANPQDLNNDGSNYWGVINGFLPSFNFVFQAGSKYWEGYLLRT